MQTFFGYLLLTFIFALDVTSAQTILARWTFETSIPITSGPLLSEEGSGSANSNTGGAFTNPGGWGSMESWSSTLWDVGDYFQFQTSSTGFPTGITVSWQQMGSNSGPKNFKLQYSTNGTTYIDLQSYAVSNDNWNTLITPTVSQRSFDLSSVAALSNAPSIYFRLTVVDTVSIANGIVAGGGTARVDNFTVTAAAAAGSPIITPPTATLAKFTTFEGTASASQSFSVTASNLTAPITLTAPSGYEVSNNDISFGGSTTLPIAGGTGYVRLTSVAAPGIFNANITLTSTGASNKAIPLTGEVFDPNVLTLSFNPSFIAENSVIPAVGTVSIPIAKAANLSVSLASSNISAVTLPTVTVTILAGELTASFNAFPVANPSSFATNSSTITASSSTLAFIPGTAVLQVTNVDNDPDAAISIASVGSSNFQNFDLLGTTTTGTISSVNGTTTNLNTIDASLKGWYVGKIAGNSIADGAILSGSGSSLSGSAYSFGADGSPERALGVVASGGNTMAMGAIFKNDTGSTLTGLTLTMTAEFWRSSTVATNTLTFGYGKMVGGITPDTFLSSVDPGILALNAANIVGPIFVAANGPLDGNVVGNQSSFVGISLPLSILPGESAFIRWQDVNDNGNDAGLAIDNVTVVGVGSGGGNTYAAWASANNAAGGIGGDHDFDGVKNGVEFFMGQTGNTFTTNPVPDTSRKVSFPKSATATGVSGIIETSPNLVDWTAQTADTSVSGFISYTLPASVPGGKIFMRLSVAVAP